MRALEVYLPICSGLNCVTVIFVILKIGGVIAWSWLWVLFPTLLYNALFAIILISTIIVAKIDEIRFKKDIGLIGKNKGDKGR